jgi:hypothetical protein
VQSYLPDQNVAVVFDLSEFQGTITALSYRVLDQDDVELVPETALTYVANQQTATVTVNAANNALPSGVTAAARVVYLFAVVTGQAVAKTWITQTYKLAKLSRLEVPSGSFLTLAGADVVATDLLGVEAFTSAPEASRVSALMEAHERLCRVSYRFEPDKDRATYGIGGDIFSDAFDLGDVTLSEFNALPQEFLFALKRAQVIEASNVLTKSSDPLAIDRESGLTNITIGESSRSWSPHRNAKSPVCPRAARMLARWIAGLKIGRA